VTPNEFLCLEIVLSFCWKLFHSTGIVEAFVRSNYPAFEFRKAVGVKLIGLFGPILCVKIRARAVERGAETGAFEIRTAS
jgi:hypothetical protein